MQLTSVLDWETCSPAPRVSSHVTVGAGSPSNVAYTSNPVSQFTRDSLNRLRSISRKSFLGGSILLGGVVMSTGGVPRITFELAEAITSPLYTYTTQITTQSFDNLVKE